MLRALLIEFLFFGACRFAEIADFLCQAFLFLLAGFCCRIPVVALEGQQLLGVGFLIAEKAAVEVEDGDGDILAQQLRFEAGEELFTLDLSGVEQVKRVVGNGFGHG